MWSIKTQSYFSMNSFDSGDKKADLTQATREVWMVHHIAADQKICCYKPPAEGLSESNWIRSCDLEGVPPLAQKASFSSSVCKITRTSPVVLTQARPP